jgi:hypothetical protein
VYKKETSNEIRLEDFIEEVEDLGACAVKINEQRPDHPNPYKIEVYVDNSFLQIDNLDYDKFICEGKKFDFEHFPLPAGVFNPKKDNTRQLYIRGLPPRFSSMAFEDMVESRCQNEKEFKYYQAFPRMVFRCEDEDYFACLFAGGDTIVIDDYYECSCQYFDRKSLCPHFLTPCHDPEYEIEIEADEKPFSRGEKGRPDRIKEKYHSHIVSQGLAEDN